MCVPNISHPLLNGSTNSHTSWKWLQDVTEKSYDWSGTVCGPRWKTRCPVCWLPSYTRSSFKEYLPSRLLKEKTLIKNQQGILCPSSSGGTRGSWMRLERKIWVGENTRGVERVKLQSNAKGFPPVLSPLPGLCKTVSLCLRIRWYFWVASMQWKSTIHDNIGNKYLYWIVKAHFSKKKKKSNKVDFYSWCILSSHWVDLYGILVLTFSIALHALQLSACGFTPLL